MKIEIDMSKEGDKRRLHSILKVLKPVKYIVEIKQYRKKRSINQNDYYWGAVVTPLASYLGYLPDDLHKELALKFIPKHLTNRITGEITKVGRSTTELDTLEFEQYLEMVRIWALTELDFLIELPNEHLQSA